MLGKLLEKLDKGFVVIALLLFSGAAAPILGAGANQVQGNPKTQAMWAGIYLITLLLTVAGWKSIVRTAMKDRLLIVLVGIAVASILWSGVPELTLRRSVALVFTTLFGIFLAARYSLKEQLQLLAWTFGIGAVLSPFASIGEGETGAWSGIYWQKNNLGQYMTIGAIVFLINARSSHRYRWLLWAGFALSVGLVLMSTSKTSLVLLITLIALWPLFRTLQRHFTWAVPILIHAILIAGIVGILLVSNTETLLNSLGKEATLTGRTELWAVLLDVIRQKPWLGYGYGAFWLGYEGPSAAVWRVINWLPNHAHNGFLDTWVELGSLGLLILVLGFSRGILRAVTWLRLVGTAEGSWPLLFLITLFLSNLTYNTILQQNDIIWIVYVAIILSNSAELNQVSQSSHIKTLPTKVKLLKNA